jgi:energy-coupling factor transporter ATP-binding protein EcfA2
MENIKKVVLSYDKERVIIKIACYDIKLNEVFVYNDKEGIGKSKQAMAVYKRITRKNSSFKKGFGNSNISIYSK